MPSDNNHLQGMNFSAMTQDRKNRFRGSYYRLPVVVTPVIPAPEGEGRKISNSSSYLVSFRPA